MPETTTRDDLEKACIQPGNWLVEGIEVRRVRSSAWLIVWEPGVRCEEVASFYEATGRIVDAINMGDL